MAQAKRIDRLRTSARTASVDERVQQGLAARGPRPRTSLATYSPAADRPDPVALLASQETARLPLLVPLRHTRMSATPFTFYRGAAILMASDLGAMPNSGIITQLCGDAHLANFGMFGAPDRSIVFDINDFDETNPGPFEWDVMRLATSFVLAGRDIGLPEEVIRNAAQSAAYGYRTQMAGYAAMTDLDIWYDRISVDVMQQWAKAEGFTNAAKRIDKSAAKARSRDTWSAIMKTTEVVDAQRQFVNDPPLLIRIPLDDAAASKVSALVVDYQDTLLRDRALLLNHYHLIDLGHKVVGVGSVGLRAFVMLMQGRDPDDLMVLQAKQAVPSVLEPYTAPSAYSNMGQRVVVGQQILQAASDVFLGWITSYVGHDFYIRQLRDMKFAPDPTSFNESTLVGYALMCGRTLARGHARAGDPVEIAAYLGTSAKFDKAIRDFSLAYTEQVNADFAAYQAGIAAGTVELADPSKEVDYRVTASPTSGVELVDGSAPSAASS